jgi:pseudouridine synthase
VVTAASDQHVKTETANQLLAIALPPALSRFGWHAIGRLDRGTTGLLLFTNDERVVEHVTSPDRNLPKRYVARVSGQATDDKLVKLRRGVTLDDGPARAVSVERLGEQQLAVTISEGRNHQVKRMLGAVGLPVLELHRDTIGTVKLDVDVGQWRLLTDEEIATGLQFSP